MTPKHFVALAAAAALSLVAALFIYSSSTPWSQAPLSGVAMFEDLRASPPQISRIEVEQASSKLTLERKGDDWVLRERDAFPATHAKVRAFLVSLTEAELVEPKTRREDRYALLSLEDPASKNANSRLVRLFDDKGEAVAEVVIGKKRQDAFGSGKGGTYVRRPGEAQTWLVNTEINAGVGLRDWVKPRLFETRRKDIKQLSVKSPGKEDLDIALSAGAGEHLLQNIPEGMKVKYVNSIDDIVEAARSFDFDAVRKLTATPTGDDVSTVMLDLANGLKCTFRIRRDGGVAWLSLNASGAGEAKKEADELNARTQGWEFQIPKSKADAILKTREELLEKVAS